MSAAAQLPEIPNGVHHGLTETEYARIPALRSSVVKHIVKKSPAHARYVEMHGDSDSRAKEFGRLLHLMVLEPARGERLVVVKPEFEGHPNSNIHKAAKAAWLGSLDPEAIVVSQEEYDQIRYVADSAHSHPVIGEMLKATGKSEVTCVWDDSSGVRCKVRIDRLFKWDNWLSIGELKSTRDASPWSFARDAHTFGYHVQAAMQLRALDALTEPAKRTLYFWAVEKEPPYGVMLYELGSAELKLGKQELELALQTWAQCQSENRWPCYPTDIQELRLPAYAFGRKGGDSDFDLL